MDSFQMVIAFTLYSIFKLLWLSIVNAHVRVSHVLLVVTAAAAYFQAAAVQIASCGSNAQDNDADEGRADVCNDALCNQVS